MSPAAADDDDDGDDDVFLYRVSVFLLLKNCDNVARTYYMCAYSFLYAYALFVFQRPNRRVRVRAFATSETTNI